MRWNLRLTAANNGVWKASELQRSLAEYGLVISARKMSGLWSGQPVSLKLEDLDVICVVLGCEIGDLLIPEPEKVSRPGQAETERAAVGAGTTAPAVIPKRGTAGRCRLSELMARFPKGYVKPTSSWPGCLAWGDFRGRLCHTCYMFGRSHETVICTGSGWSARPPHGCVTKSPGSASNSPLPRGPWTGWRPHARRCWNWRPRTVSHHQHRSHPATTRSSPSGKPPKGSAPRKPRPAQRTRARPVHPAPTDSGPTRHGLKLKPDEASQNSHSDIGRHHTMPAHRWSKEIKIRCGLCVACVCMAPTRRGDT
jgi:DNA-binding Xre family transcriptional regulator